MGEKNNKRELILAAARDIFFEKGYHNATSEEIARQAGVAKGTLYQYFSSKQEIFLEMHRQYMKLYSDQLKACVDFDKSFEENMRQILQFHLRHIQLIMQYVVRIIPDLLAVENQQQSQDIMHEIKQQMDHFLERLIDTGQQRGELKNMNKQLVTYSITGAFMGLGHVVAHGDFSEEEKLQMSEELLQNIMHGIAQ